MNWDKWNSVIHEDYLQVQRIVAAKDKKITKGIVSIDKVNGTLVVKGSGAEPYITTLSECTCADFGIRQLPCKHMYRLALEMNLLDLPKYSGGFDSTTAIAEYHDLYMSGQIPAEAYVALCKALEKL